MSHTGSGRESKGIYSIEYRPRLVKGRTTGPARERKTVEFENFVPGIRRA